MAGAWKRAARALVAAGALGGLPAAWAAPIETPTPFASARAEESPAPAATRLAALQIELAWLADPLTFSQPLEARAGLNGIEVCGFVPDETARARALALALREAGGQPVLDGLALDPSLPPRPAAGHMETVRSSAAELLLVWFAQAAPSWRVSCLAGGVVVIDGAARSAEDRLAVSRRLRRLYGCTAVLNRLSVAPVPRDSGLVLPVSADGTVVVVVEAPPEKRPVAAPEEKYPAMAPVEKPPVASLPDKRPAAAPAEKRWVVAPALKEAQPPDDILLHGPDQALSLMRVPEVPAGWAASRKPMSDPVVGRIPVAPAPEPLAPTEAGVLPPMPPPASVPTPAALAGFATERDTAATAPPSGEVALAVARQDPSKAPAREHAEEPAAVPLPPLAPAPAPAPPAPPAPPLSPFLPVAPTPSPFAGGAAAAPPAAPSAFAEEPPAPKSAALMAPAPPQRPPERPPVTVLMPTETGDVPPPPSRGWPSAYVAQGTEAPAAPLPGQAAPPPVLPLRLKQQIQSLCFGKVRQVEVLPQAEERWLVRVVAAAPGQEAAVRERLLRLPEMTSPLVKLEVVPAH